MKKNAMWGRIGVFALLLLFLVYIGYQVSQNLSEKITTIDALMVDVEDSISAEGVFVRSQVLVTGPTGKGAEYLVSDGEKVSKGQEIAIFFDSSAAANTYQQASTVDNRLSGLKYAYQNLVGGTDSKKLDTLIYISMQKIAGEIEGGSITKAAEEYATLQQLVIGRNANMTGSGTYKKQIEALESEKNSYINALNGVTAKAYAEKSGYFLKNIDGFETVLNPDMLKGLTPEQLDKITRDDSVFTGGGIGSVVDSFRWYYAFSLPKEQADRLKDMQTCQVYFLQIGTGRLRLNINSISTFDDRAVVILESGVMLPEYLEARFQPVDIVVKEYSGIKIPWDVLRQVDGVWGVYCLEGTRARFKPVDIIYQTDSYFIAKPDDGKTGLQVFDKMIINAKDLEHGKVVS